MCSLVGSEAETTWEDDQDWQILLMRFVITPSVYLECAQQELHREMSLTVQNSHSESSCNCWPAALLGNWPVLQLIISSHWSFWASPGINDSLCRVSPDNHTSCNWRTRFHPNITIISWIPQVSSYSYHSRCYCLIMNPKIVTFWI